MNREGFAKYRDWRMPTMEELASIMENSWQNSDLFIDPLFDRTQRYCWSIDTRSIDRAWKANFHLGFFMDFPMTSVNSVRPVRSLAPKK
jgi:serine/threonine-protein kinase